MTSCSTQRCETCRHWWRQGPEIATAVRGVRLTEQEGVCQAHGPSIVACGEMPVSLFPVTHESRTCGDWRPRFDGDGGPDDGETIIAFPLRQPANRYAA